MSVLIPRSAKELEHFERIRQTFESVDKQKQDPASASAPTIQDALEALSLGQPVDGVDAPIVNGNGVHHHSSPPVNPDTSAKGKGKGPATTRSVSNHSAGKGKSVSGGKWKSKAVAAADDESDSSFESNTKSRGKNPVAKYDDVGEVDGEDAEDEYVIRTDHLAK